MKRFIILLICVATLVSACNKREHEQLPIIENGTAVSVSDIEFNPFGSDFTFAVSTVSPYRFTGVPEWVTIYRVGNGREVVVDIEDGESNTISAGTVSYKIRAHYNRNRMPDFVPGDYRDATFTIKADDGSFYEDVYVKQEYPYLNILMQRPNETAAEQVKAKDVLNYDWNYCLQAPFGSSKTPLTIECNTDWKFEVLDNNDNIVTPAAYIYGDMDVEEYAAVRSNTTSEYANWLQLPSATSYKKTEGNTFNIDVAPVSYHASNDALDTRTLKLKIYNPNTYKGGNNLDQYTDVYEITISQKAVRFTVKGDSNATSLEFPSCHTKEKNINVNSELDWYVDNSKSTWVTTSKKEGAPATSVQNFTVNIAHPGCKEGANPAITEQKGEIIVYGYISKDKEPNTKIKRTISVKQAPYVFDVLDADYNAIADVALNNEKTTQTFAYVKSSGEWEVSTTKDWVELSKIEGAGNNGAAILSSESLDFTTKNYNLDLNSSRETTITVKSKLNSLSKSFKISQPRYIFSAVAVADNCSLTTFDKNQYSFTVNSTGPWKIVTDYSESPDSDWLKLSTSGKSYGVEELSVVYNAKTGNGHKADRKVKLTVVSLPHEAEGLNSQCDQVINISQSRYIFNVSLDKPKLDYKAIAVESYKLKIECSDKWTIEAPEWVSFAKTGSSGDVREGTGNAELTVYAKNNYSYDSRANEIVVKSSYAATNSNHESERYVVNQQSFVFELAHSSQQQVVNVPAFIRNEQYPVSILTSLGWSVVKDQNYRDYVKSMSSESGNADLEKTVNIVPNHNPDMQSRTFDITFETKNNDFAGFTKKVSFSQDAYEFDNTPKSFNYRSLSENAGEKNVVNILCSGNWELQNKPTWVKVDKESFSGNSKNSTLQISTTNNYYLEARSPRTMKLVSTVGGYSRDITISQDAFKYDTEAVTLEKYTALNPTSQRVTVGECDGTWNVVDNLDWIDVAQSGNVLTVTAKENIYMRENSGTIEVRSQYYGNNSELKKVVTVSQDAFKFDINKVTLNEYTALNPTSQSVTVGDCDGTWTVVENLDWIEVVRSGNELTITATANVVMSPRSGVVKVVSDKNSSIYKEIAVSQAAFKFDTAPHTVSQFGAISNLVGTVTVGECDGTWKVEENIDWVEVSRSGDNLTITATENVEMTARTKTFKVVSEQNSDNCKVITVSQAAFKFDTAKAAVSVGAISDLEKSFSIGECDGTWHVEENIDWLEVRTTTGGGNTSVQVVANPNYQMTAQSATFKVVSDKNPALYKEVTVSQAAFQFDTTKGDNVAFGAITNLTKTASVGTCDGSWSVKPYPEWIQSVNKSSNQITIVAKENTVKTANSGTIRIESEYISQNPALYKEIPVSQVAFQFDTTPVTLDSFGAASDLTKSVTLGTSDGAWHVENKPSWITMTESGNGRQTIDITASVNSDMSKGRSETFRIVSGKNTSYYKEITVSQAAFQFDTTKATLSEFASVSPDSQPVDMTTTDGSWSVASKPAWIIVSPLSGSGAKSLTVSATNNTTTEARTGTIRLESQYFSQNPALYKEIEVSQAAFQFDTTPVTLETFGAASDLTKSVTLDTSDGAWHVENKPNWITMTESGNGGKTISITASVNSDMSKGRSETFKIVSDNNASFYKEITVSQAAFKFDTAAVTLNKYAAMNPEDQTVTVGDCDGTWTVFEELDWIEVSQSGNTLTIKANNNVKTSANSGTIEVRSQYWNQNNALKKVINVSQAAFKFDTAAVTLNKYAAMNPEDQTVTVGDCDGTWTVFEELDWIEVSQSGNTLTIKANNNVKTSANSGTIEVRSQYWNQNNALKKVINVSQDAYQFSVEKTSVTIAAAGGSQAVRVTCTGNYTVSDDADWLTVSKTGGVTITATANDATEPRKAKVTVTSSDNTSLTTTITVIQEAKPAEPATRSRR